MSAGKNKLKQFSQSLFPESTPEPLVEEKTLYEEKVSAICARFVYYQSRKTDTPVTLDDILEALSGEFYISTKRLADIICDNPEAIKTIKANAIKKDWFKITWAHFVW